MLELIIFLDGNTSNTGNCPYFVCIFLDLK